MNILGKLLNVTSQVATVACGGAIMVAGGVVAGTGKLLTGNNNFGEGLKSVTKSAGSAVISQSSKIGKGCETVVNKTFEIASEGGGVLYLPPLVFRVWEYSEDSFSRISRILCTGFSLSDRRNQLLMAISSSQ